MWWWRGHNGDENIELADDLLDEEEGHDRKQPQVVYVEREDDVPWCIKHYWRYLVMTNVSTILFLWIATKG